MAGRPSKTTADYHNLANSLDLEFLDSSAPITVHTKANWRCTRCGREKSRTYIQVKRAKQGCTCWQKRHLKDDAYLALAEELGITWVKYKGRTPESILEQTVWESSSGLKVAASYSQLKTTPVKRYFILLEIEDKYTRRK